MQTEKAKDIRTHKKEKTKERKNKSNIRSIWENVTDNCKNRRKKNIDLYRIFSASRICEGRKKSYLINRASGQLDRKTGELIRKAAGDYLLTEVKKRLTNDKKGL